MERHLMMSAKERKQIPQSRRGARGNAHPAPAGSFSCAGGEPENHQRHRVDPQPSGTALRQGQLLEKLLAKTPLAGSSAAGH